MNNRLATLFNTGKKKAAMAALCGALVLSVGTLTATAANNEGNKVIIQGEDANGVSTYSYSTDDGQTWNEGVPEGAVIDEDGKVTIYDELDENDQEDVVNDISINIEDGVTSYSADGGKTWTEGTPEGVTIDEDGLMTFLD